MSVADGLGEHTLFYLIDMENKIMIEDCLLYDKNLTDTEFRIMVMFISIENMFNEHFHLYQEWISDKLGISLSTCKRALKSLENKGYIIISKVSHNGHITNLYEINWDMINKMEKSLK